MNPDQIKNAANSINKLAEQAKTYKSSKQTFLDRINQLNADQSSQKITKTKFDEEIKKLLDGRTRQEELETYDRHILETFDQISEETETIKTALDYKPLLSELFKPSKKYEHMNPKLKKKYLGELNMDPVFVKSFIKRQKSGALEKTEKNYVAYEPNKYGKIANVYAGKIAVRIIKKYPSYFEKLFHDLQASGFKVLSKTYVSMIIFSASLVAIIATLLASSLFSHQILAIQILRGIMIGLTTGAIAGAAIYIYPSTVVSSKQSAMKSELPFALIHMSAVAGSGAKPIAIFQTLLTSRDYPALGGEIKKIVNYVNVFGYDLSTSLRLVAMTTPSPEFKDLLNGMINTISSGGDLKQFLTSVSQDSLSTYQMERKNAVEVIATYSDIYTALLIAAPLLFFVTIAIIQMLGGQIGGLPVEVIATIGTYGAIPLMNIGYLIFISAVQPK